MKHNKPFKKKQKKSTVYVQGGNGPYLNTTNALKKLDLSCVSGKRILVKPNVGRIAPAGKGITTHPMVVGAIIDYFRNFGAIVAVGESPIVGVDTLEAFDSSGITEIAKERNCPLIDLNVRKFVKIEVPEGIAINSLKICPEVREFDYIVSVPVMKTHMHTGVTLSIKNMKGCLWRRSKVELHMLPPVKGQNEKPIDIAIADLAGVLKPDFVVIDGTVGMEGLGPGAGTPKSLDVIVASSDAFAADSIACNIMGMKAETIPHLQLGSKRGYGNIAIDKISVSPNNWQEWINPFEMPPNNLSIEFPNITVLDKNSCSACQSTLYLFLKGYGKWLFEQLGTNENLSVAIGKGHSDISKKTLCIGNCTVAHKKNNIFIKGCPPVSSEIIHTITGKPSFDVLDGHSKTSEEEVTFQKPHGNSK